MGSPRAGAAFARTRPSVQTGKTPAPPRLPGGKRLRRAVSEGTSTPFYAKTIPQSKELITIGTGLSLSATLVRSRVGEFHVGSVMLPPMIRMPGQHGHRAVELLQQHDSYQLVRP